MVGDQDSAGLSPRSQAVFDTSRQLIARRAAEEFLPLVEIDRCQRVCDGSALGVFEIEHDTTAPGCSKRQLRLSPATGEPTLPRQFAHLREP